ncbi:MAG: hypothetical protein GDA52_02635 [Rhodobacteraceae bacterium]|nr:hypothetical protein [Paracoccaceae bacterium]
MGSGRHRNGGLGKDTLTGGAGADTFLFRKNFGKGVITDFRTGGDFISLHGGGVQVSLISRI